MSKPLLPLVDKSQPWSTAMGEGINQITPNLFEGRLYTLDNIQSSGVPSIFAHPFIFSKKLERSDSKSEEFNQFSILIKGVFLGVIEIEVIPIEKLGRLGEVLRSFQPGIDSFTTLEWKGEVIGGVYPESLVFPSVRVTRETLDAIELENMEKENIFDSNNVIGHFRQWVNNITGPPDMNNSPVWAQKLNQMINIGGVWDASNINLATLPNLSDRSLHLANVNVNGGNIPLMRYMEHLIVCNNTIDGRVKNLSKEVETELRLGPNGKIICMKSNGGGLICGQNCTVRGEGPLIKDVGFFERSSGEYVIWKDFEVVSYPKGCTDVKYFDDHAIFSFGKLKIRIDGKVISKDDIICTRVIKFDNGKMPDLPVKSDYLDCVESVQRNTGETYSIKLKGLNEQIVAPNVKNVDKASILLWPSFKDTDWMVNYSFFRPSTNLAAMNPYIRLININEKGETNILSDKIGRSDYGVRVDSPITHVEILLINNDGQEEMVGVFKDGRQNAPPVTNGAIELSLDFGTANTIIGIETLLGGGAIEHKPLELEDKTFDMLGYHYDRTLIHTSSWWLPSYMDDRQDGLCSVPSELIFLSSQYKKNPSSLDQPICKYSIPHKSYFRDGGHEHVISNFKWSAPFPLTGHEEEITNAYLKMVMHMALAVVRDKYNRNSISLSATYPLAFGLDKYNSYKTLLDNLINEVQDETGFLANLRMVTSDNRAELIPESHAGKARYVSTGYQLVVDIGGGTTDIALSKGDKILAVDSLKYGGNTFIESLANEFSDKLLAKGRKDIKKLRKDEKNIILNRQIRTLGFKNGVLDAFSKNKTQKDDIIRKLKTFFNGLFEYVDILLKSRGISDNISLYPIGNAWEFIDAIPNMDVDQYISDYFDRKNIVLNPIATAITSGARKEAVIEGALILSASGNFIHPNLRHPIISVVGCNLILSWNANKKSREIEKNECIPLNLNLSQRSDKPKISTKQFIESLPLDKWQPKNVRKNNIDQEFNRVAGDALIYDGGSWWLTKSLFAEFLSKIVPQYYI